METPGFELAERVVELPGRGEQALAAIAELHMEPVGIRFRRMPQVETRDLSGEDSAVSSAPSFLVRPLK